MLFHQFLEYWWTWLEVKPGPSWCELSTTKVIIPKKYDFVEYGVHTTWTQGHFNLWYWIYCTILLTIFPGQKFVKIIQIAQKLREEMYFKVNSSEPNTTHIWTPQTDRHLLKTVCLLIFLNSQLRSLADKSWSDIVFSHSVIKSSMALLHKYDFKVIASSSFYESTNAQRGGLVVSANCKKN